MNQRKTIATAPLTSLWHNFVRAGQRTSGRGGILTNANDWVLLVDHEHHKTIFTPHINSTSQRPDIIIWSRMKRSVVLLELTCCAEEGVKAAQQRKEVRYQELIENINESGWNAELLTIEVWCSRAGW